MKKLENGYTLLVDDDEIDYLEDAVCQFNRKAIIAKNGKEAFKILMESESVCDLLITDYQMPEMNGLELILSIFQSKLSVKNIILVSGHPTMTDVLKNIEIENTSKIPFNFYPKPLEPHIITHALASIYEG